MARRSARAGEAFGAGRRPRGKGGGSVGRARGSARSAWAVWAPLLCLAAGGAAAQSGLPALWNESLACNTGNSEESTCSIIPRSQGDCFFKYFKCWYSNDANKTQISYDGELMLTNFSIWNLNGSSHIVLSTETDKDVPNEWIVETNKADEVHITGLPGKEKDFSFFNASNCVGCPTPVFKIDPIPREHTLLFQVIPETKYRKTLPDGELTVHVFESNQTNFSNCNNIDDNGTVSVKGSYNKVLPIRGIYSQEFCFVVYFSTSNHHRFGWKFNMTEAPYTHFSATIPMPVCYPIILIIIIVVLLTITAYYYAVCKGWLKPRGCCIDRCKRRSSVAARTTADISLLPMPFMRNIANLDIRDSKVVEESTHAE